MSFASPNPKQRKRGGNDRTPFTITSPPAKRQDNNNTPITQTTSGRLMEVTKTRMGGEVIATTKPLNYTNLDETKRKAMDPLEETDQNRCTCNAAANARCTQGMCKTCCQATGHPCAQHRPRQTERETEETAATAAKSAQPRRECWKCGKTQAENAQ